MPEVSQTNQSRDDSLEVNIDYFLAYRVETIRDLLRSHQIPVSGKKSVVRKRLLKAVEDDLIDAADLS